MALTAEQRREEWSTVFTAAATKAKAGNFAGEVEIRGRRRKGMDPVTVMMNAEKLLQVLDGKVSAKSGAKKYRVNRSR